MSRRILSFLCSLAFTFMPDELCELSTAEESNTVLAFFCTITFGFYPGQDLCDLPRNCPCFSPYIIQNTDATCCATLEDDLAVGSIGAIEGYLALFGEESAVSGCAGSIGVIGEGRCELDIPNTPSSASNGVPGKYEGCTEIMAKLCENKPTCFDDVAGMLDGDYEEAFFLSGLGTCYTDDFVELLATALLPTVCFSPETLVQVEDYGAKKMKDLAVGDKVLTASGAYERVYDFGDRNDVEVGQFLKIATATDHTLEISGNHLLFKADTDIPVPAAHIRVGDSLRVHGSDAPATVTEISKTHHKGFYSPLTASGTIVVDGLVASTYVGFSSETTPDSATIPLLGFEVSAQFISHYWETPNRLLRMVYTKPITIDNRSVWGKFGLLFEEHVVFRFGLFGQVIGLMALLALLPLYVAEWLMTNHPVAVFTGALVLAGSSAIKK